MKRSKTTIAQEFFGTEIAAKMSAYLTYLSVWFVCKPLANDNYEFTVKEEATATLLYVSLLAGRITFITTYDELMEEYKIVKQLHEQERPGSVNAKLDQMERGAAALRSGYLTTLHAMTIPQLDEMEQHALRRKAGLEVSVTEAPTQREQVKLQTRLEEACWILRMIVRMRLQKNEAAKHTGA